MKQRGPSKLNNYLSVFICVTTNSQILAILLKDSLMKKKRFHSLLAFYCCVINCHTFFSLRQRKFTVSQFLHMRNLNIT